jgi:hypothetical protein
MDGKKVLSILLCLAILLIIAWSASAFFQSDIMDSFLREAYRMLRFALKFP